MHNDLILWLEDRPETITDLLFFFKKNELDVKLSQTVDLFKQHLEEYKNRVKLIIIDIMLFPVMDLECIGISDSSTDGGYEAGIVVIDRFLRPMSNEVSREYMGIPILMTSSRRESNNDEKRRKSIERRGGSWIRRIEKGGMNHESNMTWIAEFEKIVLDIKSSFVSIAD